MIPFDDDRDGLYDEDGFDDINGDGEVTFMRRKNPNGRYKIDPEELLAIYKEIEKNKWELLAIYHSHTHTEAYPSSRDIESAVIPGPIYLIVSLGDSGQATIRGFRIAEGKVTEIPLRII